MKILYIHDLGSTGNSRTARILQEHYKDSDVYNPDIPFEPESTSIYSSTYSKS